MSRTELTHFKLFFDLDKELEYILEMNRLGWRLERVTLGSRYRFVRTEPEEYTTLIYAEKRSRVRDTAALAMRCGYEEIPHKGDGLSRALYLTGRRDEVSPVFFADEKTTLRAYRLMFKRLFVITLLCVILTLALIAEVGALFIAPAIISGSAVLEYPAFFILTIVFSVIALVFFILSLILIKSTVKIKNKLEKLLPNPEKEKQPEPDKKSAEAAEETPSQPEKAEEKTTEKNQG